MSGLALYLAILNRWPALAGRIAIMTGDAEADEVRAWLERNPCAVLRKPFNLRQIFQWLDAVLAAPGRESGNGWSGATPTRSVVFCFLFTLTPLRLLLFTARFRPVH